MEWLMELLVFGLKALILVVSFVLVIGFIFVLAQKSQLPKGQLQVEELNDKYKKIRNSLKSRLLKKKEFKALMKAEKKAEKKPEEPKTPPSRLFVLDFKGDVKASRVESLREEISAILTVAQPGDEVLCRIESQGGLVHTYGLAASQLQRFRDHKIKLITSIDKVAASGGYLMACVGEEIFAAPFAIVGSIGVVAQVPNLHRLLKKHEVDFQEYTAGEYKRTVSLLGPITPEGEQKFREQLHDTHALFQGFVKTFRPQLQMDRVATGEYWYGTQAVELGLVDRLMTSDEYLMRATENRSVYKVCYEAKKTLGEKLSKSAQAASESLLARLVEELSLKRWWI